MGRFPHQKRFELPSKADYDIVEQNLKFTDIAHLRDRGLQELSGGERQRAILAQALAQKPRLLLMDEPTAYLDIGHQIAMLDLVKKLNRTEGLTVVMILHDLNLASEYCEKMILMDKGNIEITGTPKEVLTYENIEKVYKTVVVVKENPFSKKPYVIPVSGDYRLQTKDYSQTIL
jgi:iron complex transport system ATP-binding protein